MRIPFGTCSPLGLETASRNTLESAADPSHPGKKYTKFISESHTPSTLVDMLPFRVLKRGLSLGLTWT